MHTSDVPRIWRQPPLVATAYEEGQRAGRAGVSGDGNPWREKGPEYPKGHGGAVDHALRENDFACCGAGKFQRVAAFTGAQPTFSPLHHYACKRCIRAVEAERKRLAEAWEEGRSDTQPK